MRNIFIFYLIFLSVVVHAQIYTINGFDSRTTETGDQRGWVYTIKGIKDNYNMLNYDYGSNTFHNCNQSSNTNRCYRIDMRKTNDYFEAIYTPEEIGNGETVTCSANFNEFLSSNSKEGNISFSYSLDGALLG